MISFIVPFRDNGDLHRRKSFNFVVESLMAWPDAEVIIDGGVHPEFNRSEARNHAAKRANGDILVFVDADSWLMPFGVIAGIEKARKNGWAFPYTTYCSLTEKSTDEWYSNYHKIGWLPEFEYEFPGPDPVDRPAAVGGCVVVSIDAFHTVGGYDERFEGWGFEDRAFALALGTLVNPEVRCIGSIYHLWHQRTNKDCFEQPNIAANRALYARYQAADGDPVTMHQLVVEHH